VDETEMLERLRGALGARYALERELGRGGMGAVYLARDLKPDREVAIKVLDPALATTVATERLMREIRITHPAPRGRSRGDGFRHRPNRLAVY
jgi:hypothetical protein